MIESEAIQFGVKLGYLFGVLSGFALAMLARPWGRVVLRAYRHRVRSAALVRSVHTEGKWTKRANAPSQPNTETRG